MQDSETVKRAMAEARRLRLPLPEKGPTDIQLKWPSNVGDLTPEELAQHLTWWSGWAGYAVYHLARAETNHAAYSKELSIETQKALHGSKGDYGTVTELKAAVAQLPSIELMENKVIEASAVKRMIKALVEDYNMKHATISREISRRDSEISKGRRS